MEAREAQPPNLDGVQGAGEQRIKPYINTVKEQRSLQHRNPPKAPAKLLALLAGRLVR